MVHSQADPASVHSCQSKSLHSHKAQQPHNVDNQARSANRQLAAAAAAGLVRVHSCMSPPRVLKRNSSGLPSATATYTALRKAAAGGSLIPDFCQPKSVGGRRRTSHDSLHGSKLGNKLHAFQRRQHADRSELCFPSKQVRLSIICDIAICGLLS